MKPGNRYYQVADEEQETNAAAKPVANVLKNATEIDNVHMYPMGYWEDAVPVEDIDDTEGITHVTVPKDGDE